jgi:nucleotide-binding universal stress UspA family protein
MDDPLSGIEVAIGEHNIDLLTIIIKKRTFLDRLFHKSVSKQIAREVAIPILTLHE